MRTLFWSKQAERDIDRIEYWLDRIDPALADDAIDAILERVLAVQAQPGIGSPLPGGRRKIIERRFGYVVLYRPGPAGVTILRVRHAREDWR